MFARALQRVAASTKYNATKIAKEEAIRCDPIQMCAVHGRMDDDQRKKSGPLGGCGRVERNQEKRGCRSSVEPPQAIVGAGGEEHKLGYIIDSPLHDLR